MIISVIVCRFLFCMIPVILVRYFSVCVCVWGGGGGGCYAIYVTVLV